MSITVSDIAELIKTGALTDAKRQAKSLLTQADPHDLEVVSQCAYILETWPKVGILKLQQYWRTSDTHDRAIIAACAPDRDEARHNPTPPLDRQPRWTPQNKYQAPRDIRHEVHPELRRPPRHHTASSEPAVVETYLRERGGVDDSPTQDEPPTAYVLDYDRAALPPLRGTPCVCCWLERATRDQTRTHDDGLCTECRDRGRPGIPCLPHGHTSADVVQARCAFITAKYPQVAYRLLRRYWQQCPSPLDRDVIATWAQEHDITATNTPPNTNQTVTTADADKPALALV